MSDITVRHRWSHPATMLGQTSSVAVAVATRATLTPWRLLMRKPTFLVGAAIIVFWIVCAIFKHAIAPYNPLAQQLLSANVAPSEAHWFGTDPLNRDVLSRIIVSARDI